MRFRDLPKFTQWGHYETDVDWDSLEYQLERWIEHYSLDLDPDFQREHVWDEERQIKYVEFVVQGGRTGKQIIFNCPGWQGRCDGQMVLVDGKQRIQAIRRFLNNEIKIFEKYFFKDFEDRRPPHYCGFKFLVNNLEKREQVLKWYLELNTGGIVHTEEEIEKVKKLLEKEKNL